MVDQHVVRSGVRPPPAQLLLRRLGQSGDRGRQAYAQYSGTCYRNGERGRTANDATLGWASSGYVAPFDPAAPSCLYRNAALFLNSTASGRHEGQQGLPSYIGSSEHSNRQTVLHEIGHVILGHRHQNGMTYDTARFGSSLGVEWCTDRGDTSILNGGNAAGGDPGGSSDAFNPPIAGTGHIDPYAYQCLKGLYGDATGTAVNLQLYKWMRDPEDRDDAVELWRSNSDASVYLRPEGLKNTPWTWELPRNAKAGSSESAIIAPIEAAAVGEAAVGNVEIRWYLTKNGKTCRQGYPMTHPNDPDVGMWSSSSMSVDARHQMVQPMEVASCGVPAGTYVMCAVIDPDCAIAESREDDNVVYSDMYFTVKEDDSAQCGDTSALQLLGPTENCGESYAQPTASLWDAEPDAHDCFADDSPPDCSTSVADYVMTDVGTLGGTTSGRAHRYQSQPIGQHTGGTGLADVSVQFTAPTTDTYVFDTTGSAFDAGFYLVTDLGGATETATASSGHHQGYVGAHLSQSLSQGQVIYLVVDGDPRGATWAPFDSAGAFVLNVARAQPTEEVCHDRRDLDDDGLYDCADADCWLDGACIEICDNAYDDNADGRIDCVDPICGSEDACLSTCPVYVSDTTSPTIGTTAGDVDHYQGTCAMTFGEVDVTAEFTAPTAGTYVFDTVGSAHHPRALYLLDSCGGAELTCGGEVASSVGETWNQLAWPLAAHETVVVVVDGVSDDAFTLNVGLREAAESDCADGRDLDDDGAADCLDSDCSTDASCVEQCDDEVDNDLDGDVDCLDAGCELDAACFEDCDNGADDNANGLVDCDDTVACFDDPACDPFDFHVNTLGDAIVEGDLRLLADDWDCSCAVNSSGGTGKDAVIEFTSPISGELVFDLVRGSFATRRPALCIFDELGGTELACDLHGNYGAQLSLPVTVGQVVTLVVDASKVPQDEVLFRLNVAELEAAESVCEDLRDLDDDGHTDCDDADCDDAAYCTETALECTDYWDNDDDGETDCQDADCVGEALYCEDCENGVDDDSDGYTDCDDLEGPYYSGCHDVTGRDVCWEYSCLGYVDDDGDGDTDCEDTDCIGTWMCP